MDDIEAKQSEAAAQIETESAAKHNGSSVDDTAGSLVGAEPLSPVSTKEVKNSNQPPGKTTKKSGPDSAQAEAACAAHVSRSQQPRVRRRASRPARFPRGRKAKLSILDQARPARSMTRLRRQMSRARQSGRAWWVQRSARRVAPPSHMTSTSLVASLTMLQHTAASTGHISSRSRRHRRRAQRLSRQAQPQARPRRRRKKRASRGRSLVARRPPW